MECAIRIIGQIENRLLDKGTPSSEVVRLGPDLVGVVDDIHGE